MEGRHSERGGLLGLALRGRRKRPTEENEQPLRAELFSTGQLEQHAKALAGWHEVEQPAGPDRLLRRLEENELVLLEAHRQVMAVAATGRQLLPADEWLLDNFYLIEE